MEYSKFSEMILVNVKNEPFWRLRAVETWARKLTFDVLAPKPIYLDEALICPQADPIVCQWIHMYTPEDMGFLLFPTNRIMMVMKIMMMMMISLLAWTVFCYSNKNPAHTSLRTKADVLTHFSSKSSNRWSQGSASSALKWFYLQARNDHHSQVKHGDSSLHNSMNGGTICRAREPVLGDDHGFGFGHVDLVML